MMKKKNNDALSQSKDAILKHDYTLYKKALSVNSDAKVFRTVTIVSYGVGAAAIITGVVFLFVNPFPSTDSKVSRIQIGPPEKGSGIFVQTGFPF
jgi:hypothetical protein